MPGALLFVLIGALGATAVTVAVLHRARAVELAQEDGVLGVIGLCGVTLAVVQVRRLLREARGR